MDLLAGDTVAGLFRSGLAIIAEAATEGGRGGLALAGAKEVWTVDFIPALARALPDARFAVIHRDPRAVVMSLLALAARDPTQKAHPVSYMRHWRKQVILARRFAADPALQDRLFVTTFETLCRTPEPEMRRLCATLGIGYDAAMLRPGEASGWTGNSSFGPSEEPIDPSAAQRWRGRIPPGVKAAVEFHCGPEMRVLGYDVADDAWRLTPAIAELAFAWHADPGKWRSDSGDPAGDLAWETLRNRIAVEPGAGWPESMLARCLIDHTEPAPDRTD